MKWYYIAGQPRRACPVLTGWPGSFPHLASGCKTSCGVREMTMRVRVKLFATLSRYFGDVTAGTPFEIEAPDGATLTDLVNQLKLPREEVNILFVNGRSCSMDW